MSHLHDTLERIAAGIERLAEDPVIQMETGPPVCPHCGRINPTVEVQESGGSGALAEFVIRATCAHCRQVFYALPIQWKCVPEISQVEPVMDHLKELSGYGDNGNGSDETDEHERED